MIAQKNLDIVIIGTPDHWHALPMIAAVEAGIDVYVQKPIGVDVVECQAMLSAARKNNAVVQVGMQRRSTPHLMEAKEKIVDSGKLGEVGQVEIFSYYGGPGGPLLQDEAEVPEGFDYDMWCGPAPKLPYYPFWRNRMEYGNGTLGDMGVHMFDMARWMLNLRYPKRVTSVGGQYIKRGGLNNCADTQTVIFDYETMQIVWNHRVWSELPDKKHPWGGYFYGKNGLLKASVFGYDFHPYYQDTTDEGGVLYEDAYPEDKKEPNIELHVSSAVREHMRDFIARVEDRGRPRSDIEEGAISTICCVLGNLSMELHRSNGTKKPAKSRTTTKPTRCSRDPIAPRGCIRKLEPLYRNVYDKELSYEVIAKKLSLRKRVGGDVSYGRTAQGVRRGLSFS